MDTIAGFTKVPTVQTLNQVAVEHWKKDPIPAFIHEYSSLFEALGVNQWVRIPPSKRNTEEYLWSLCFMFTGYLGRRFRLKDGGREGFVVWREF